MNELEWWLIGWMYFETGNGARLQVGLEVARVEEGHRYEQTRTGERPKFAEAEQLRPIGKDVGGGVCRVDAELLLLLTGRVVVGMIELNTAGEERRRIAGQIRLAVAHARGKMVVRC